MKKNIFNTLLVLLLIFICVYFAFKISGYGLKLEQADNEFGGASLSPYITTIQK